MKVTSTVAIGERRAIRRALADWRARGRLDAGAVAAPCGGADWAWACGGVTGIGADGESPDPESPVGIGGGVAVAFRMASRSTVIVASSTGLPGSDE